MYKKEEHWVECIRNGDEKAFEELFFHFHPSLSAYAMSITKSKQLAKDVVQEVFFKIWRGRENWEITESLKVYLFRAVRNQSLNLLLKEKNKNHVSFNDFHSVEFTIHGMHIEPPDESDRSHITRSIWNIVSEMPERRKQVFTLHKLHGLSYEEIAGYLKIKGKTVENHMALALQSIRESLDPDLFKRGA